MIYKRKWVIRGASSVIGGTAFHFRTENENEVPWELTAASRPGQTRPQLFRRPSPTSYTPPQINTDH